MKTTLIKSYEIDGLKVEIRVSDEKEDGDEKIVAQFLYELLAS